MDGLASLLRDWQPAPVVSGDRISGAPVAAFSALLDLERPAAVDGEALPPSWHWLYFHDHPRSAELGDDGHPSMGAFLPPIPDRRRMFAGGRMRVHRPVVVGDEIERTSELESVEVKNGRGGEMALVTVRHRLRRPRDAALLIDEELDFVYRSQAAGEPRPAASPRPGAAMSPPDGYRWSVELPIDSRRLFRFSALTNNAHRIHYDVPYATEVEGYPGLVVHGPLLAMLLLEVPRRALRHRVVTAFEFRLRRPLFANTVAIAGATPDKSSFALLLRGGVSGEAPSITGRVELG